MNAQDMEKFQEHLLFHNGFALDGILPNSAIEVICAFARSNNPELRMRALEKMRMYKGRKIVSCLKHSLSHEKNALVIVSAIESIGNLKVVSCIKMLKHKLHDRSPMVRGYAAIVLSELCGKKVLRDITGRLKKERSTWAKAALHVGIYKIGAESIHHLLALLNSRQYRVRAFIVNSLGDLKLKKDSEVVRAALQRHLKAEASKAVVSAIRKALRNI